MSIEEKDNVKCLNKSKSKFYLEPQFTKEFVIGELFKVTTGNLIQKEELIEGKLPRISVKTTDNGILGYFKEIKSSKYIIHENFISINFLGKAYYHGYKASLEMKVHAINNPKINKFNSLYIVSCIDKVFPLKYDYGNQLSSSKLKSEVITLPVKSLEDTEPDWEYMENYTKEIEKKAIQKVLDDNRKEIENLEKIIGI